MNENRMRSLLSKVQQGEISVDAAVKDLSRLPFVDTENARVDTHRALRQGIPEVIFGLGKTPAQIAEIGAVLREAGQPVLVTRIGPAEAEAVQACMGEGEYDAPAQLLAYRVEEMEALGRGSIAVVSAGTADQPVAAEAAGVAEFFGNRVDRLQDVGVAGLHRLLAAEERLRAARVLIVVAGMEGALPSVVGGLVDKPVIAVPTSTGYGVSMGGFSALLGMLSSCASNVSVVNIDNGFGAAYAATLINRL
ncbi:MAG: nickel pincer cofactor biosynthesis protein LarB [Myxococcota bacterium]|nr:nickel pincer cofactor biosynthesis protein LarB [Myxococcota bacterium]